MKQDRVEFTKTIQTGTPLNPSWEKVFIGAQLDENEDPKESLEILKREVEEFHAKNSNVITGPSVDWPVGKTHIMGGPYGNGFPNGQIPVVQRSYEKLEIQIDNCKSLEELKELKEGLPRDLMSAYMNKLKELMPKPVKTYYGGQVSEDEIIGDKLIPE